MTLSTADRKNLEKQLIDLRESDKASQQTASGLQNKLNQAKEDEAVYKRQFDQYHSIITSYEKEVETINGEHYDVPFTESDIQDQTDEKGRLYQGTITTAPKIIPEMVGQNLSASKTQPNETDNFLTINHILNTILNGEDPFSFSPTSLFENYTAGDASIKTSGSISSNHWYLIGGNSLLYVSSVTYNAGGGHCVGGTGGATQPVCEAGGGVWVTDPSYYTGTIGARCFLSGLDNSNTIGSSVASWSGYSNTERTNKVATSTTQGMMNTLFGHLGTYLTEWMDMVFAEIVLQNKNPEQPQDSSTNTADKDWLMNYLPTMPLQDGTPGVTELQDKITARQSYNLTRSATCRTNKTRHYGARINMTKMRCDLQAGTLKVVKFISNMKGGFPDSGNPTTKEQIAQIEQMLNN